MSEQQLEEAANRIMSKIGQFIGTTQYFNYQIGVGNLGILLTDGVHWLAEEANCYWLITIIVSVVPQLRAKDESFVVVELKFDNPDKPDAARVWMHDGNYNTLYRQDIDDTDFPLRDNFKLFMQWDYAHHKYVVMLPSEY